MSGKNYSALNIEELAPLLAAIANGDERSFASLVDFYWNNVYYHALTYTRSPQLAEETTQDIFIKVWGNRNRLQELDNFENFLFILARNAIISAMRKKSSLTNDISDEIVEKVLQPDRQLAYKKTYEALLKGIEQMPSQRRRVFTLSRLEGLNYEEISQRMGISRNTIKEHIVKGINFLKGYMDLGK